MIGNKLKTKLVLLAILPLITNCSHTYSSSFGCGDAVGAMCMPMDKVDRLIASGEIENFTKAKCKGGNCKKDMPDELPAVLEDENIAIEFEVKTND